MASWSDSVPPAPGTTSMPANYPHPYATAYTPVSARQSLTQPYPTATMVSYPGGYPTTVSAAVAAPAQAQAQASQNAQSSDQRVDWPLPVREYVQRAFTPSNFDHSLTKEEIHAKLKETITTAHNMGKLSTIDWKTLPLPQEMIREERAQALRGVPPPAWSIPPRTPVVKKRKSSDITRDDESNNHSSPAPQGKGPSLKDRITQSVEKRSAMDGPLPKPSKSQKMEKRQRRFDGGYQSSYRSPSPGPAVGPVVGTCTDLEKRYLRLTSAPNPAVVRPEYILRQTLAMLKKKWKAEGNYSYICDQFKSMRQDLTVQRIRNEFTIEVYEIHARIALEKGDLGEYNQCQTQLLALYAMPGLAGSGGSRIEFKAYRILYFIHTANRSALNDAIADLTAAEKQEEAIKHALGVRSAIALGNYHRLFQLYVQTETMENMAAYLMDMFVGRERLAALSKICRSYKPDVRLRFITDQLGFESDMQAVQFIIDHNGQHLLEERDNQLLFLAGKAGNLFDVAKSEAYRRVDIKGQI